MLDHSITELSSYQFGCTEVLLSAAPASGGFSFSYSPIRSHPCRRLAHAFVTSRIDPCSSLLVGLPLGTLAWLDRALRSAARSVGRLPKFSPITAYMRDVLNWLPISQQLQYRITALISRCVLRCASSYLRDLCCPVSVLAARRVLHSATSGELLVPRARLAIMQRRAFSVVGLSAWKDLPVELRSLLMTSPTKFYISLKSFFLGRDWAGSASE